MAEIGKYRFQIIKVVSLRYIELKCAIYAINVYLSSLESKQNYLKASFFYENGACDTKKIELVYKMNQ